MQTTYSFLKAVTTIELGVVLTIALTVVFMLGVIIWEILNALDRATKFIIRILYVPLSRVAYLAVQGLILAIVAFAVVVMIDPQIQYDLYLKLGMM
jgi:hypothetical protein